MQTCALTNQQLAKLCEENSARHLRVGIEVEAGGGVVQVAGGRVVLVAGARARRRICAHSERRECAARGVQWRARALQRRALVTGQTGMEWKGMETWAMVRTGGYASTTAQRRELHTLRVELRVRGAHFLHQ